MVVPDYGTTRPASAPLRVSIGYTSALVVAISALAARSGASQQPAVFDTVTGTVTAADSTPIPMARVDVTGDDGRAHSIRTDDRGRFVVVMPGNAGIYQLHVRAFGYVPLSVIAQRAPVTATPAAPTSGRIIRALRLNPVAVALEPVRVVASGPALHHRAPADRAETWSSFLSEQLPVDLNDFAQVASLQLGVARTGPAGANISVAGQAPDQNHTTVDDASYDGTGLPAEGVRSTGVIANTYDVSHGQFSGGEVTATTISGTNIWGGSLTAHVADPALQFGALPGNAARDRRSVRLSGGGGGALIKDRLFVYGALDASDRRSPIDGLNLRDPAALRRLQLSPDSAQRFLQIAGGLGVPSSSTTVSDLQNDAASFFTRLDYSVSDHHSLMVRADWRKTRTSGLGASPLNLSSPTSELRTHDRGVLVELTSTWTGWTNELRVHGAEGGIDNDGGLRLPAGELQVISALRDGTLAPSLIGFGRIVPCVTAAAFASGSGGRHRARDGERDTSLRGRLCVAEAARHGAQH